MIPGSYKPRHPLFTDRPEELWDPHRLAVQLAPETSYPGVTQAARDAKHAPHVMQAIKLDVSGWLTPRPGSFIPVKETW